MAFVSQTQTVPPFHLGASTGSRGCSPQNFLFYTAPSSPIQLNDDEFEFEITSRMYVNRCEFQQTYPTFQWANGTCKDQEKYWLPSRAKSFCSGEVMPLKLPPRLQTSVPSSPRSPNSIMRIPFARSCAWNDDFDPFQFALEKVSEETRARMSFHRRSHSYCAYRNSAVSHWLNDKQELKTNHGGSTISNQARSMKPNEHLKRRGPTLAKMMERRQSVWVPSEPTAKPKSRSNPMVRTNGRGVRMGRNVKDADHKAMKTQSESSCCTESKMQRVISFLFKLKNGRNEISKTGWKLRRCIGNVSGSPP